MLSRREVCPATFADTRNPPVLNRAEVLRLEGLGEQAIGQENYGRNRITDNNSRRAQRGESADNVSCNSLQF